MFNEKYNAETSNVPWCIIINSFYLLIELKHFVFENLNWNTMGNNQLFTSVLAFERLLTLDISLLKYFSISTIIQIITNWNKCAFKLSVCHSILLFFFFFFFINTTHRVSEARNAKSFIFSFYFFVKFSISINMNLVDFV